MTKDPDTLEIMENWSERDIKEQLARLQEALRLKPEYDKLSEEEKDAAWDKAAGY